MTWVHIIPKPERAPTDFAMFISHRGTWTILAQIEKSRHVTCSWSIILSWPPLPFCLIPKGSLSFRFMQKGAECVASSCTWSWQVGTGASLWCWWPSTWHDWLLGLCQPGEWTGCWVAVPANTTDAGDQWDDWAQCNLAPERVAWAGAVRPLVVHCLWSWKMHLARWPLEVCELQFHRVLWHRKTYNHADTDRHLDAHATWKHDTRGTSGTITCFFTFKTSKEEETSTTCRRPGWISWWKQWGSSEQAESERMTFDPSVKPSEVGVPAPLTGTMSSQPRAASRPSRPQGSQVRDEPLLAALKRLVHQRSNDDDDWNSRKGPEKGIRWRTGQHPPPPSWKYGHQDLRAYAKFAKKVKIWQIQMQPFASPADQALLLWGSLTGDAE